MPFELHRPVSAAEAAGVLAADPQGTVVLGGGTLAVPALRRRPDPVRHVIDLGRAGLGDLEVSTSRIRLGAKVTYSQVLSNADVQTRCPLLTTMARGVTGGTSIRHQATLVGALCQASPTSDVPAALVALDATVVVVNTEGTARMSALEHLRAAAGRPGPAYLVGAVEFAVPEGRYYGYQKLKFAQGTWPIVTTACWLDAADGEVTAAGLVLGAMDAAPVVVEMSAGGATEARDEFEMRVASAVTEAVEGRGWSDEFAPTEYRRAVAPVVALRAVRQALASIDAERGTH